MKKKQIAVVSLSCALILGAGALATYAFLRNAPTSNDNGENSNVAIDNNGIDVKFLSTTTSEEGYPVTSFSYSISPSSAPQSVTCSLSWAEKGVEGDPEDYISVSANAETKLISVTCKKAFSHVINLKVASTFNATYTSTVTLNYVQKFLGWNDNGESKSSISEIISDSANPTSITSFTEALAKQENARYTPNLSEVYTKAYPDGDKATYAVTYKGYAPRYESPAVTADIDEVIKEAMAKKHTESRGTVWTSDTSSTIIDAFEDIYKGLPYATQRYLNSSIYLGLERKYTVKATLGSQTKEFDVSWVLRAKISDFSTYVEDISGITVEVPNIDF